MTVGREDIDDPPQTSRNWTMTLPQSFRILPALALISLSLMGCHPKEVTPLQRKEAASVASEAEFAMAVKDFARAENLYTKATDLAPDAPDYWLSLGSAQKLLGKLTETRKAYEAALRTQKAAYKKDPSNAQLLLDQVYVAALLGKLDDARSTLKRAIAEHGSDPQVKNFTMQSLDSLLNSPDFKALAL